ncbi:FAD:protein FMN transferase [Neisseriaceae bacterium TC5R-5]|nr:FAD:protein FMN transferase [Neisseriaceae bacterium TC5R-5]
MGTYYRIKYIAVRNALKPQVLQIEIDRRLEQVNQQMSTYRPDSELSRFNQSRVINQAFSVSAATSKVVAEAIRLNQQTQGALDITVGPLVNLWGFGPTGRREHPPSAAQIEQALAHTGIAKLGWSKQALIKKHPQLYLDLSAIAKGYGVDVIADYLRSQQISNYMVDIGGDMRVAGHNGEGGRWRIAIEKPTVAGNVQAQLIITPGDMAIATSGDYRHYFEEQGRRYSHTIDPRSGRPIEHHLASVTVLSKQGMTADGLATGLDVLGPERAIKLADELGLAVFLIVKTGQGFSTLHSKAFQAYLPKGT